MLYFAGGTYVQLMATNKNMLYFRGTSFLCTSELQQIPFFMFSYEKKKANKKKQTKEYKTKENKRTNVQTI